MWPKLVEGKERGVGLLHLTYGICLMMCLARVSQRQTTSTRVYMSDVRPVVRRVIIILALAWAPIELPLFKFDLSRQVARQLPRYIRLCLLSFLLSILCFSLSSLFLPFSFFFFLVFYWYFCGVSIFIYFYSIFPFYCLFLFILLFSFFLPRLLSLFYLLTIFVLLY